MSLELPPLHRFVQDFHRTREMPDGPWCFYDQVEARERILTERIAELERQLAAALEAHDSVHDALANAIGENAELANELHYLIERQECASLDGGDIDSARQLLAARGKV